MKSVTVQCVVVDSVLGVTESSAPGYAIPGGPSGPGLQAEGIWSEEAMIHLASRCQYHTAEVTLELYDVGERAARLGPEWFFDGHWWVARRTQDPMHVMSLMPDHDAPRIDQILPIPRGVYEYDAYMSGLDPLRANQEVPEGVVERWIVRLRPSRKVDPHPRVETAADWQIRALMERGIRAREEAPPQPPQDPPDPRHPQGPSTGLGWVVPGS
jgi:hypothetical protein